MSLSVKTQQVTRNQGQWCEDMDRSWLSTYDGSGDVGTGPPPGVPTPTLPEWLRWSTKIFDKTETLQITLNIHDTPIPSKSHTHPSHFQNSRLLRSSPLIDRCIYWSHRGPEVVLINKDPYSKIRIGYPYEKKTWLVVKRPNFWVPSV
jgi:hypothetical protein